MSRTGWPRRCPEPFDKPFDKLRAALRACPELAEGTGFVEGWLAVALLATVLLLVIAGCGRGPAAPSLRQSSAQVVAPRPGALAPDFTVTLLDGRTLALADLRGRPLILNFWATWCVPCRREMPLIETLYAAQAGLSAVPAQAGDGLTVLAVNYGEGPDVVAGFVTEGGYTFPIALDRDLELARTYLVHGMPTTYFIDRDGIIRQVHIGEMAGDLLQSYVTEIEGR
ncbi:MAG: TlpA family protein disulfide reductase [Anaerolineae bacterium]